MNLLAHQVKYAQGYPDKGFLAHEGGTGKTVCACVWLRDGRDADALVVCPSRVVKKWQAALKAWDTKATVMSEHQFKVSPLKEWSARVIDEADEFASPLFTKGRSQRTTKMYEQVKKYPDTPTMLLTATPIRSSPWNLHTLLCFYGHYIDWKEWRSAFFVFESRPYIQFKAWFPRSDWRELIVPVLEKYADIVLLKDCVGELPPATEEVIQTKRRPFVGSTELHPAARFYEEHQFEQELKHIEVLEISKQYRKVLVVAYYTQQINALTDHLSKDRKTFTVDGHTKNQEQVLNDANAYNGECFLIVQAGLAAGFDADTFSAVIFASMSYKVRDMVQMKYRVRRIHNLSPVVYYYLLSGRCDKMVYKTIQAGRTFVPSEYKYDEEEE